MGPLGPKRRRACCALSVDRWRRLHSALTAHGSLGRLGWRASSALLLSSGVHVHALLLSVVAEPDSLVAVAVAGQTGSVHFWLSTHSQPISLFARVMMLR